MAITSTTLGTIQFCINGGSCQSTSYVFDTSAYGIFPMVSVYTRRAAAKVGIVDYFSFNGRGLTR